jgi:predicted N-acetyltransferase YhbS
VGHILFTSVVVESAGRRVFGMGLAPMAVLPERQRQGIGGACRRRCAYPLTHGATPAVLDSGPCYTDRRPSG